MRPRSSAAVGDVNGDSKADIVGSKLVMLGNGDGTFQPRTNVEGGVANKFAALWPIWNGDGKLDLVATNDHFRWR